MHLPLVETDAWEEDDPNQNLDKCDSILETESPIFATSVSESHDSVMAGAWDQRGTRTSVSMN